MANIVFSQTDTTFSKTKTYKNSNAPDTVIIERIKVKKERIYVVKRDTIVKTDTVVKIKKETIKDTVVVYKRRDNNFVLGITIGSSLDYDHTHYWSTFSEFYNTQQEQTKEIANWNASIFTTFEHKNWLLDISAGAFGFREKLLEQSKPNKLVYLSASVIPSYKIVKQNWGHFSLGLGTGIKTLVKKEGFYINPKVIDEISNDDSFYLTNNNLWFLIANIGAQFDLNNKIFFRPQLWYQTHPTSITTTDHPILFWRDAIGINLNLGYTF